MNIFTIFTSTFVVFRKDGLRNKHTNLYGNQNVENSAIYTRRSRLKNLINDNGVGEIVGHFVREERVENEVIERWEGGGVKTAEL
jgi:hypothetical protein